MESNSFCFLESSADTSLTVAPFSHHSQRTGHFGSVHWQTSEACPTLPAQTPKGLKCTKTRGTILLVFYLTTGSLPLSVLYTISEIYDHI